MGLFKENHGLVVVSSDPEEVVGVCDRVTCLRDGSQSAELVGAEFIICVIGSRGHQLGAAVRAVSDRGACPTTPRREEGIAWDVSTESDSRELGGKGRRHSRG